jgi:hypothetical protein
MEITSFPQAISFINYNTVSNSREANVENQSIDISSNESLYSSIEQLVNSKVIYQNPLLMATAVENYPMDIKPYQPDVTAKYKVNPVKAIYDSNKAHD